MRKDAAHAGRGATEGREKWRAEVGPMLPGAVPRLLRLEVGRETSFERLVFPEVSDRESQWVDGDQFIGNLGLENEEKIRGVQVALKLAVVGGRVVDHVEVHASAVRR